MRRRNRQCKRFAAKPVHDNIYWQPTQGSVQGAQDTLDKKAGNAMDTASLLIALLRASGIPARYVYGSVEVPAEQMMNWVGGAKTIDATQQVLGQGGIPSVALVSGGKISAVRIEHTWVEALIQYQPGRGAKHVPGQSVPDTWVHLNDHVFPRLPVRQWVLSVPKRLRYFMQRDGAVLSMVLRIFLRVIAQTLQTHSPGAAHMDKAGLHIGAIAFIHRFGSSLNEHVHFHVCVVDGVFEEVEGEGDADATPRISSPGVIFHAATGIDAATVAPVQTTLQKRILRAFVARGLLEN